MANLLILVILAFMAAPILAAPFSNTTVGSLISGPKPVFEPEPPGRGTIGLIVSCSATFIICIWTSVHADIAPLHASSLIRFKYKAVWMVVSAAIPEGLIMCAFGQWLEARRVRKVWSEAFKDRKGVKENHRKISMDEAFFVVMGGFTVYEITEYIADDGKDEKPRPVHYTSTLTPHGFKKYVLERRIDSDAFEKRHIVDKGKGSNIAKAIACLQVLWLVMQCITRKLDGLPLTLLELHVAIQVGCTIVTYSLWWFKPLDVEQPIRLTLREPKFPDSISDTSASTGNSVHSECRPQTSDGSLSPQPPASIKEAKKHYKSCHKTGEDTSERYYITRQGPPECLPTIALAFHDIVLYLDGKLSMMLVESLLTIPIGGLHAVAWNVHFPTPLESWMWRVSSIVMCTVPVCVVFIAYWGQYQKVLVSLTLEMSFVIPGRFKNILRFLGIVVKKVKEAGLNKGTLHLFMIRTCLALIALYAGAVVYITVESYISVRSPPEGTFRTPTWSNFVPHV